MKLLVYMMRQDDPKKCTAAKLAHFEIAYPVRRLHRNSIVLNPYAELSLCKSDRNLANSVTAIDCSWERANNEFKATFAGINRRLPLLLAGNPTNYSKLGKLSSAEALAAACVILGYDDLAFDVMNKFKWGHTFLELNDELLKAYSSAADAGEIRRIEQEYWPDLVPRA